jgi:hypothetical protein
MGKDLAWNQGRSRLHTPAYLFLVRGFHCLAYQISIAGREILGSYIEFSSLGPVGVAMDIASMEIESQEALSIQE